MNYSERQHIRGTADIITLLKYLTKQQKFTKENFPQTGSLGQDLTKRKIIQTSNTLTNINKSRSN